MLKRRPMFRTLILFTLLALPAISLHAADPSVNSPNILLIVADDMGYSDLGCFGGEIRSESDWLGWELFGNRAIRQGDWKLLYLLPAAGGSGDWELIHLKHDPAEMYELSATNPEKKAALLKLWDEYVTRNGVIVSDAGPFANRKP